MSLLERKLKVEKEFSLRYGASPQVWVRAPGRVDLMGSHTDYNMGFVMTMTINRDTWIAARPRQDARVRISSLDFEGVSEFGLEHITKDQHTPWANYVRGMAKMLSEAGYPLSGFDGLIHSTVPLSSGLSSSAALEMAAGVLFQQIGGFDLDPVEMALLGQRAENLFVGVNSGILDQYSSALGEENRTLLLDCRELTSRPVQIAAGLQVVICDTNAKRTLVGSEYDERRAQCEAGVAVLRSHYPEIRALRDVRMHQFEAVRKQMPEVVQRRCLFILQENQRVLDLEPPLAAGDEGRLKALFSASYQGARDLYEIGAPAMTHMMDAMLGAPGVIAARQAGAGFGGCLIALVKEGSVDDFSLFVQEDYFKRAGIQARIYPVIASPGAGVIDWDGSG